MPPDLAEEWNDEKQKYLAADGTVESSSFIYMCVYPSEQEVLQKSMGWCCRTTVCLLHWSYAMLRAVSIA